LDADQQVAGGKLTIYGASLTYENDGAPFEKLISVGSSLQDGQDKFRTNAVSLGYAGFDLRLNLFTGNPNPNPDYDNPMYPLGVYTGNADKFRLGALSLGYGEARVGWNSEGIRNLAQYKIAHTKIKPQPWFRNLGGRRLYGGIFSNNNYSLWWF
jgi:hypothetical protein